MKANEARMAEIIAERKKLLEEIDEATEERTAEIEQRVEELELEERKCRIKMKNLANTVEVPEENVPEGRQMSTAEQRAAEFIQTGRTSRQLLSTGSIAKPASVSGEINELAEQESTIVDDVKQVPLTGTGSYTEPYRITNSKAKDVKDGESIGGDAGTFGYRTIDPNEWGILDEISNQVKKMTSVNYLSSIENSALVALRVKAEAKIFTAIQSEKSLAKRVYDLPLDENYLRTLVLGFNSIPGKGGVKLYITQADLGVLGKVRGKSEKKALYEIKFNTGTVRSGVISEGGMAVPFSITDELADGTQVFGQPKTVDLCLWDEYEIKTDEGGDYFKRNMIGIRGLQTAGADLCALHGMQVVKQEKNPTGGDPEEAPSDQTGE